MLNPDDFYVVGGTVIPEKPCYVKRHADQEIRAMIDSGESCYVLTSRQMGKSSLMASTVNWLRENDVLTAVVDLSGMDAQRWHYAGIAHVVKRALRLDCDLKSWWHSRDDDLGCRLETFFRELVLPLTERRVVIFIDEIDRTRTLDGGDDLFAALRACIENQRGESGRLSFVMLGAAHPSDLITGESSPFEVAAAIRLRDFSLEQARPLAAGLGGDESANEQTLSDILDWTGGHPYLTQKLCLAVAQSSEADDERQPVDDIASRVFLEPGIQREYNLHYVHDRVDAAGGFRKELLERYMLVRASGSIPRSPESVAEKDLIMSGLIVEREDGSLEVRNRIYKEVFGDRWLQEWASVS